MGHHNLEAENLSSDGLQYTCGKLKVDEIDHKDSTKCVKLLYGSPFSRPDPLFLSIAQYIIQYFIITSAWQWT